MATIYVDNLINPSLINVPDTVTYKKSERIKEYSFSDLHLDFQINSTLEDGSYGVTTNDIVADYDNDAIKNSIKNIFNTRKGMRYLNPEFGSSFDQFLFESVSPINARILAQKINDHIIKYENRITLLRVFVQSMPEEYQYEVSITYRIKSSSELINLKINLSENGAMNI